MFEFRDASIPNNGGSRTFACVGIPEDPSSPQFIPPLLSILGTNVHFQTYYQNGVTWDPLTRTVTFELFNTTPGAGEDGFLDFVVWFPHTKVR